MKYPGKIVFGILLITLPPVIAQTRRPKPKDQRAPSSNAATSTDSSRGQQVFEQNCSRCHNAPEGFSSRISETVAMHMRVRANLSEADYKALQRFFNP